MRLQTLGWILTIWLARVKVLVHHPYAYGWSPSSRHRRNQTRNRVPTRSPNPNSPTWRALGLSSGAWNQRFYLRVCYTCRAVLYNRLRNRTQKISQLSQNWTPSKWYAFRKMRISMRSFINDLSDEIWSLDRERFEMHVILVPRASRSGCQRRFGVVLVDGNHKSEVPSGLKNFFNRDLLPF